MAALSNDRVTKSKGPLRRKRYLMAASQTIYKGGMVCLNASRLAVPAADTAGLSDVVGIAAATIVSAASGSFYVTVDEGLHLIDVGATVTQIDIGQNAAVTDDQTAADGPGSTNKVRIGRLQEYLDETQDKAWIDVGNPAPPRFALSAEITGNGASQNTAHGLGAVPWGAVGIISEYASGAIDVAPGAHTATNSVFTVTSGVKYYVQSWVG